MAKGGYRKPGGGPRASGVGKNSQRSDAAQPIRVPNVQDAEDLSIGDRQKLEASQRIAPIGRARTPQVAQPSAASPSSSGAGGGAELAMLMGMESRRPREDVMTPASPPPVEPADDQEVVLQWLVDQFGDKAAHQMLTDKRAQKAAPPAESVMPAAEPMIETPTEEVPELVPTEQAPMEAPVEDEMF